MSHTPRCIERSMVTVNFPAAGTEKVLDPINGTESHLALDSGDSLIVAYTVDVNDVGMAFTVKYDDDSTFTIPLDFGGPGIFRINFPKKTKTFKSPVIGGLGTNSRCTIWRERNDVQTDDSFEGGGS